jgi:hypothetical protein
MQFDLRVTMMKGKYEDGAKKVLSEIPLVNPASTFMLLEEPFRLAQQDLAGNLLPLTPLQLNRNAQIRTYNTRQQDAYNAGTHIPWTMADRSDFPVNSILPPAWFHDLVKGVKYGLVPANIVNTVAPIESWGNPSKKELFDWFEDWVKLVNMKNKELKTFLDSDWGAVAGLSPQEAKDWNNIKSGRVSGRRILKMRKKLGLTGPKDYIDPNKPRVLESYYERALNNWTGPSDDMQKGETDWDWCKRQVRFNKRFMGDVFGERKGPLVRKQKTQNQPSRRLLSLWVWGHDPWRYARKVEKRERMPKCPNVPWIGMTEKRKWGVIEVIPGPKKNPAWPEEWQSNPPRPHDGDAIITVNEVPWGTQIIAECPFDGIKSGIDAWMEDACNHIYPECGHVLRINPDKPCCCENSEHPPTHPDHWPNTRDNPRTKKGRKFPSKYLKGLTATEKAIAKYEIDKGYEYSMDDPEAYKFWKSDIKAKARGMKILPSKWRNKFARKYGPLKDGYDFLDRMSKTTGVKRKYLKKIQDKGLAAWRVGHRPGVTQMQWARGRVYAFVMAAPSSTGPGKPDHKLAVEAGVR